jgi:hypothetical protein
LIETVDVAIAFNLDVYSINDLLIKKEFYFRFELSNGNLCNSHQIVVNDIVYKVLFLRTKCVCFVLSYLLILMFFEFLSSSKPFPITNNFPPILAVNDFT